LRRGLGKRPGLLLALLIGAAHAGCAVSPGPATGSRQETLLAAELIRLRSAPWCQKQELGRFVVSDPHALVPLYRPVAKRLGVLEIRTPREWELLRAAIPELGPCPDLRRGIVIGLIGATGTILGESWPFRWVGVRAVDGAGLIEAQFECGTYLADDTTYVELAQVDGVQFVAAVGVDGLSYSNR
jgi:hypothetical protein